MKIEINFTPEQTLILLGAIRGNTPSMNHRLSVVLKGGDTFTQDELDQLKSVAITQRNYYIGQSTKEYLANPVRKNYRDMAEVFEQIINTINTALL